MIYLQGKNYSVDRWRSGRFTVYTVWDEKEQNPLGDFSTQDFKNARERAIKLFEQLMRGGEKR